MLLDSGRVIRFKKPGAPEWEGIWSEGAGKPRAHVLNGVLFVSHDDTIELIDTGTGK